MVPLSENTFGIRYICHPERSEGSRLLSRRDSSVAPLPQNDKCGGFSKGLNLGLFKVIYHLKGRTQVSGLHFGPLRTLAPEKDGNEL